MPGGVVALGAKLIGATASGSSCALDRRSSKRSRRRPFRIASARRISLRTAGEAAVPAGGGAQQPMSASNTSLGLAGPSPPSPVASSERTTSSVSERAACALSSSPASKVCVDHISACHRAIQRSRRYECLVASDDLLPEAECIAARAAMAKSALRTCPPLLWLPEPVKAATRRASSCALGGLKGAVDARSATRAAARASGNHASAPAGWPPALDRAAWASGRVSAAFAAEATSASPPDEKSNGKRASSPMRSSTARAKDATLPPRRAAHPTATATAPTSFRHRVPSSGHPCQALTAHASSASAPCCASPCSPSPAVRALSTALARCAGV